MKLDVEGFVYGPMPTQPLGWFKKEVKSAADFKGMKYRTVGLSVDVFKEMGAAVVALPGAEIVPALDRGLIDAAEFNNTSSDRQLGFPDVSKNCMLQSYHQPVECFEVLFNKKKYDALAPDLKNIIRYAAQASSADMSWKVMARNSQDYLDMKEKQGVKFHRTPKEVLQAQLAAWDRVVAAKSADNPFFAKVVDSQRKWAQRVVAWYQDVTVRAIWLTSTSSARRADVPDTPAPVEEPNRPGPPRSGEWMQRWIRRIDLLSSGVGKAFAWLILVLTAVVTYDVIARYVFGAPTDWAFDTSYILYGTLFMMAGAYTLARNGHVRGDFLYANMKPRTQAALDLLLYVLFFIPGIGALAYSGVDFTLMSWHLREHSSLTSGGPPIYPFKAIIPIAGALVLLQGFAEITRCVVCLRTGEWPTRLKDVAETDVIEEQLAHSEHVDEEARKIAIERAKNIDEVARQRGMGGDLQT